MKTIERLIIYVLLTVLAFVFGCEEEPTLSKLHWDVIIEEKRAEGYHIAAISMKKQDEGFFLTIIDSNYDYVTTDPNIVIDEPNVVLLSLDPTNAVRFSMEYPEPNED